MKIGTLNVKNIETNREMLQSCDILALQEHWLFSFQLSDMEMQFPTHNAFSKSVDEDSPLPPTQKPREYGGVSILYRKNMSYKIKKLPLGACRMVVVEVEVASLPPLRICNVYMPSRNTKRDREGDGYRACLDQVGEIILTYNKTHAVLVIGDLNASLTMRKGNQQDMQLKQFVDGFGLSLRQHGECTFFHPNTSYQAEIDYILYTGIGADVVASVDVEYRNAANTSDHVPVVAVLNLEIMQTGPTEWKIKC